MNRFMDLPLIASPGVVMQVVERVYLPSVLRSSRRVHRTATRVPAMVRRDSLSALVEGRYSGTHTLRRELAGHEKTVCASRCAP
jgi:hypothetical protein